MSAPNTQISWGVRYQIGGTFFNAVSGEVQYTQEAVDVTDSESAGGRLRAAGVYEAEITVRGNLARDVNVTLPPYNIAEGTYLKLPLQIFFRGIGLNPDVFNNVYVDRFREVAGPDMNSPATFEFHGYTSSYSHSSN